MQEGYFNYVTRLMEGWWDRRDFIQGWRQLNRRDRRWTPPYHPTLVAALTPGRHPHMDRLSPALVRVEAMPGRPNRGGEDWRAQGLNGALMEQTVASAVVLSDPRRRDRTAYLGLLSVANDMESLERLLTAALEQSWARGFTRLVGPTALSPHLGCGALQDYFNLSPPLYTPYQAALCAGSAGVGVGAGADPAVLCGGRHGRRRHNRPGPPANAGSSPRTMRRRTR